MKDTIREAEQKDTDSANGFLQGQLLIAMPNLGDPFFERSVTLIRQHNQDGCFGLTINYPMDISVNDLFEQLTIKHAYKEIIPTLRGGPVQIEQGFVLHDGDKKWENTLIINQQLSVTASKDILFDIAEDKGPNNYVVALGCASWGAGQMEEEIMNNSWLNCDPNNKIIFELPYAERWEFAADTLGININTMTNFAGHD